MEKEKKAKHFIQQPEFPGGPKELTKFIYANLRYPEAALEAKIEGTVIVEYDIDYRGNVVETRLLQGLGFGCDEEAIRIVRLLKFIVGRNRGVKVVFHQKARIRFKMPAPASKTSPAPSPTAVQVNYVYTTTTKTPEPAPQPESKSYSYTLTIS